MSLAAAGEEGTVPGLAVITAFVLVVVSIAVLVMYVHHLGQALRVSALIELVGDETRKLMDHVFADKGDGATPDHGPNPTVTSEKSGVVTTIGHRHIVEEARRAGCAVELVPELGEFIPAGAPLMIVHGDASRLDQQHLRDGIVLKFEPELEQDVAYRLRMLATSPSVPSPTRRSRIRPPQCRRSTGCTIASVSWRDARSPTDATSTTTVSCG